MTAELSNPATSLKLSIDGDDHVLIVFDEANRRLMIEGIGARYQIRAADVERLVPFVVLNYSASKSPAGSIPRPVWKSPSPAFRT